MKRKKLILEKITSKINDFGGFEMSKVCGNTHQLTA